MYQYRAYGVGLRSEIRLSGVPITDPTGRAEIEIHEGSIELPSRSESAGGARVDAGPGEIRYRFEHGTVGVFSGDRIVVDRAEGASDADLLPVLVGSALGMCLHFRGLCVLHGACVDMHGRAVAFLGPVGAGKSTLGAACHSMGHPLLTDDLVVLNMNGDTDGLPVPPGFPLVKLDEAAADYLSKVSSDDDWPRSRAVPGSEAQEKRFYRLDGADRQQRSLDRCYLLEPEMDQSIEPIPPQEQGLAVVGNAYAQRRLEATETMAPYFETCSPLANAVSVKRLRRPDSFAELPEIIETVERDGPGVDTS